MLSVDQIIHYSGHSNQNYIFFENEADGCVKEIPVDSFVELIKDNKLNINATALLII